MDTPIKITNISTREAAELTKRLLELEKPGWTVVTTEQPGGKFTVTATPPAADGDASPVRVDEDEVTHPSATVDHIKPLLDLIAKAESAGNYDAYYGAAGNTDPKFTEMSVDQVIAWQMTFVTSGSPSSAVGRYQIIRGTLKGLKKNLKLVGNEKFDAAMQDRMGLKLLKVRGLESYLVGTSSVETFINDIAKEWAGLPNMSGKSHYDGDGRNSAQIKLSELKPVVEALR